MTESAKEILEDAKATIKSIGTTSSERFNNPLLGPFIIATIIYNWRPLSILFFSGKTLDCKIQIIDEKYCGLEGLLWPIGVAFIYYLAVPIIMAGCEMLLLPIEKLRIWSRYSKLRKEAEEELTYQAARSGNKELEALNNEIKNLKAEMALMIDTHESTVTRYIKQIEDLNQNTRSNVGTIINLVKPTTTNYEKFNPIIEPLKQDFIISLFEFSESFDSKMVPKEILEFLSKNNFIENKQNRFVLTDIGHEFFKYLNSNYVMIQRPNKK